MATEKWYTVLNEKGELRTDAVQRGTDTGGLEFLRRVAERYELTLVRFPAPKPEDVEEV